MIWLHEIHRRSTVICKICFIGFICLFRKSVLEIRFVPINFSYVQLLEQDYTCTVRDMPWIALFLTPCCQLDGFEDCSAPVLGIQIRDSSCNENSTILRIRNLIGLWHFKKNISRRLQGLHIFLFMVFIGLFRIGFTQGISFNQDTFSSILLLSRFRNMVSSVKSFISTFGVIPDWDVGEASNSTTTSDLLPDWDAVMGAEACTFDALAYLGFGGTSSPLLYKYISKRQWEEALVRLNTPEGQREALWMNQRSKETLLELASSLDPPLELVKALTDCSSNSHIGAQSTWLSKDVSVLPQELPPEP